MNRLALFVMLLPALYTGLPASGEGGIVERWHLDAPLWEGTTMHGESLFFLEETSGASPSAPLLFHPTEILDVVHPPTGRHFELDKDYTLDIANNRLVLTTDSPIPSTTYDEFRPAVGKSGQLYKDKSRDILFDNVRWFHDRQVEITYRHSGKEWATENKLAPPSAVASMPRLMKKLTAGEPITYCLLGDSISAGLNASETGGADPKMPPYGTLVAGALEEGFGSKVTYTNFSVGGMAAPWGLDQAPAVAKESPDLVLLAFGMNDASGKRSPAEFRDYTQKMIDTIRAIHPNTTFVLVASMEGNADWVHATPEFYAQYRDVLATITGPEVVLADVTSVWQGLMRRKRFVDLTGNGVNHPNDFTHRVYAQVVLALFDPAR